MGIGIPNLEDDLELYNYEPANEIDIPRYSELETDVENFKLNFTATVASTNFLEDLDTQDLVDLENTTGDLNEAKDGVKKMKDGVNEFDSKAMDEINKYAGDSLKNVIRRLRAVKELDQRYTNYSGIPEGVKGSVYFVFETEEIK